MIFPENPVNPQWRLLSSQLTPVEASPFFFTSPLIFSLQRFQSIHQASCNMLMPLRITVFTFKWCYKWSRNIVAYRHFNLCSNKTHKQSCLTWVMPQHFTGMHFFGSSLRKKNWLPMNNFRCMHQKFPFQPQHLLCLFSAVEFMPKKKTHRRHCLPLSKVLKYIESPMENICDGVRFSGAGSTDIAGSRSEIHHIETFMATVCFEKPDISELSTLFCQSAAQTFH